MRFLSFTIIFCAFSTWTSAVSLPLKKSRQDSVKSGQLKDVVVTDHTTEGQILRVDLNKTPVNSAQDLLRKVPGLFIAQHAGGGKAEQIFLRGFDNDHGTDIRISADGMPVNIVSHAHGQGYADLHFMIPELVSGIDFGKGSYQADKGDFNTSGYVDFHTRDVLEQSMLKVEGGSFNTARMLGMFNILHDSKHLQNAYVAGEYSFTNGPFDVQQRFNRLNLFAKYSGRIGPNTTMKFEASTFSSNWNASGQIPERAVSMGLIGRFGSIDTTEGGNTSRSNLLLGIQSKIGNRELNSTFYYSRYKFNLYSNFTFYLEHPDRGDEIQQVDDRDIYGMDHSITLNYHLGNSDLSWKSGLGMRYDNIHNLELSQVSQRDTLNERLAWGRATEVNMNAYSALEWKINKFTFLPGLRLDWFSFNYFDRLNPSKGQQGAIAAKLSPKFNVFYDANEYLRFFFKTGLGFHSNDVRDAVLQNGKQVLPGFFNTDLGIKIKALDGLYISPALWYSYLHNEFVWNGDGGGVSDVGATRRLGADLSLRYQPLSWLYLDADMNYARPRLVGAPRGENYVELAPTLTGTGGLSVQIPCGLTANIRYRYMHDRPANEDNSLTARGYFVNDLLLGYNKKHWGINMQVQNLFNVKWNEATFAETTRLKGEAPQGVNEITFTPGTPVFFKVGANLKF